MDPDEDFINAVLSQVPTVYVNWLCPTRDAFPTASTVIDDTSAEASKIQDPAFINHARMQSLSVQPSPPELITVRINEQEFTMELDAGAAVSILPHQLYKDRLTAVPLQPVDIALTGLSGGINVVGAIEVSASLGRNRVATKLNLIVADAPPGFHPLLGRDWLDALMPHWINWFKSTVPVYTVTNSIVEQLMERYAPIFDPTNDDPIRVDKVTIVTKDDFQPVFLNAYQVPFAKIPVMDAKIDALLARDLIYPVRFSRVASPVILVPKKNNDDRMCADLKRAVNPYVRTDVYRMPVPNDLFATMAGGACFTLLDLSDAYTQLEVDDASQELLTINTHRGLFRYRRLIYGLTSAPSIFQRTMDSILQGIPDVYCYVDDILIKGST